MGRLSQRDRCLFRNAISAAVRGDVNELCSLLLIFCAPSEPVDRPSLFTDIDSLLNRYETLDVGSINLMEIRNDVVAVADRNGLSLPKGVSVLGRGLVTIEGVLGSLSPEINVMQVMVNHLSSHFAEYFDPQDEIKKAVASLIQSGKRAPKIPAQVSELLKMGIRGQTKTNVELTGSEKTLRVLGRMVDRIVWGCAEGGLLIASAILSLSGLPKCFLGIPAMAAAGFSLAAVLGIWFLWGMFHRRR
jgi:ubiquinone biosynthesis protein